MTRMAIPDPHEGVTGRDRTEDDLLNLDPARRRIMTRMARCLYRACLVGNQAPNVKRMWDRMTAPQIGDLVMETTNRGRDDETILRGFGILIARREEWSCTLAEYEAEVAEDPDGDYERGTDSAWYVQYGPDAGDVCRWVDCDFIAVLPDDLGQI